MFLALFRSESDLSLAKPSLQNLDVILDEVSRLPWATCPPPGTATTLTSLLQDLLTDFPFRHFNDWLPAQFVLPFSYLANRHPKNASFPHRPMIISVRMSNQDRAFTQAIRSLSAVGLEAARQLE